MPAAPTTRSGKRNPSAFDVAREAGVSQTTVSFVLNDSTSPRISEATTKRVLDAVQKLGYRPNTLARSLVHGKSNTVGVLLPYLNSDYHEQLVLGLQSELQAHGYNVIIVYAVASDETEKDLVEFLLQHRVDAIACFLTASAQAHVPGWLTTLEQARVPVTIVDNQAFSAVADFAMSDDASGMRSVVNHLYDLGHRRISFLAGYWPDVATPARVVAFGEALAELGLTYDVRIGTDSSLTNDELSAAMVDLLESSNPPTAFVAQNDYMFESFVLNEMGTRYRVPEDVSLVGYGNTYLSKLAKISTVDQNPGALGKAIAIRLRARLDNTDLPLERVSSPTNLIDRGSTGPPRG